MLTVLFLSQKGGVGKTLIITSLATALAMRGYRTWLIDLDPGATASRVLGVNNPGSVNGSLTYLMGVARTVKVSTAFIEDGTIGSIRIIPPGTSPVANPYVALPSASVLGSRLSSLIRGIGSYRARPNFILIDTPALSPALNPGLTTALISNTEVITLVATDEPGGMGWLGSMLEYASAIGPGRESIIILNKLSSIKGSLDIGVKNVIRILRNSVIEAAWRLGSIPYLIKDPGLSQFRKAIDELAVLLERLNAERVWARP
ncbi:MAG: ParA family protein [Vulcanisaeta sp.]|jgi:chromosome partitioning protein|uniref:ParA family protein n=2 Tax=Thermoproteaceae TaxID=2267 RepID=UPI003D133D1E